MRIMLQDLLKYRERILAKKDVLVPDIRWDGVRRRSRFIADTELARKTYRATGAIK